MDNTVSDALFLIELAQNDYMIDGNYLPKGKRLLEISRRVSGLVTENDARKNEMIGGLATVNQLNALQTKNEKLKEEITEAIKDYPTMYYAEKRTQDVFYKSLYRLEKILKRW